MESLIRDINLAAEGRKKLIGFLTLCLPLNTLGGRFEARNKLSKAKLLLLAFTWKQKQLPSQLF